MADPVGAVQCTACGLVNPSGAVRCDCGAELPQAPLPARPVVDHRPPPAGATRIVITGIDIPLRELARLLVMVALAAIPAVIVFYAAFATLAYLTAVPAAWLVILVAFGLYWRFIRSS